MTRRLPISRRFGFPVITRMCGYAFEIHPHNTDILGRGGADRPETPHNAGNVSLLWMRREAAANGLVLEPADVAWVPDDIDFGISDSMNVLWRTVEYIPIKHQVSSKDGTGEETTGWDLWCLADR